jgi:hypothetical protein
VLVNGLCRLNAGLGLHRFLLAFAFWIFLTGSAIVLILIPRRRWQAWHFLQNRGRCAIWPSSILIAAVFIPIFICLVATLVINPPEISKGTFYSWEFLDKRWIVALFMLSVVTIYLPGIFHRLIEISLERGSFQGDVTSPDSPDVHRAPGWSLLNVGACIIAGTILSVVYVGAAVNPTPRGDGSLTARVKARICWKSAVGMGCLIG